MNPQQKIDLNAIVLETPLLKSIVHKQMSALIAQSGNPDWITFTKSDSWKNHMEPNMTAEAKLRYELHWRVCYKSGVIQEALMKHPPTMNLEMYSLAGHAMVYIWRELCEDRPEFEPLQPPLSPYNLEQLQMPEIRLRVAGLFAEARRIKVLDISNPDQPRLVMTRPAGDVDLKDYERLMNEGMCPHIEMRWEDTNELETETTPDAMQPGVIIGSEGDKNMYQRQENGSLVNITKHPEKRRRDLPGDPDYVDPAKV